MHSGHYRINSNPVGYKARGVFAKDRFLSQVQRTILHKKVHQVGVSLSLSTVVLIAFPAVLLGGLDSFPGAIVGGIIVGLVAALAQASKVIEVRNAAEIAPYVLLLIVLVIRPEGLFGQKRIERI